jgi:hypothetical protein
MICGRPQAVGSDKKITTTDQKTAMEEKKRFAA